METASSAVLTVERKPPAAMLVRLSGNWRGCGALPSLEIIGGAFIDGAVKTLEFDSSGLSGWDSRFVAFIARCSELCRSHDVEFKDEGLPEGVRSLLRLSRAVPQKKDTRHLAPAKFHFLENVGEHALRNWDGLLGLLTFLGENVLALGKLLRGRAQFRWADALLVMQRCGPEALGIVAMINFLVGLILAFVGAIQLQRFGATIYVADLVGIATVREMGCVMTGIILCGRTGAAFAAELATMKLNEEISALQTFGISPIEFLVLPRMIALLFVMPFLCIFADLISILGGYVVSLGILDITPTVYLNRTIDAIELKSFLLGIAKGSFFGFLIAYTGCLRGMQSGYNATAVGQATTRAVVTGISAIIASDGVFAVISHALNI